MNWLITHELVVNCRFARELRAEELVKLLSLGSLSAKGRCSSTALKRIQVGSLSPKSTKKS